MSRKLIVGAVGAAFTLAALPAGAHAAGTVSAKFDRPGEHEFVVPADVRSLQVKAIGERGGYGKREDGTLIAGGFGGDVSGTVFVKPKRSYWIEVDVGGGRGGPGALPGGDGGGASTFRVCRRTDTFCDGFGSVQQSRVIVAAGGGGTAGGRNNTTGRGGNAGAAGAMSEIATIPSLLSYGGFPGTQIDGGDGGDGSGGRGFRGELEQGGQGAGGGVGPGGAYAGGGGGGGGYFGGGGGGASANDTPISGGGGGGGANRVSPTVQTASVKTATANAPSVELTWLDDVAPDPSISSPAPDATVGTHPTLRGKAGTAMGDADEVAIDISTPGGTVLQKRYVPRDAKGDWTAQLDELAPGTYVAMVAQGDWAKNAGRGTVTFRVEADPIGPKPKPAPVPQVQPVVQAPVAPAPAPSRAAVPPTAPAIVAPAAIRIETTRARVVRGTLSVRLQCTGLAGQRCSGRLVLTARRRTLASAPYSVAAGKTSTVRVKVRRPLPRRVTAGAGKAARTITLRRLPTM